MRRWRVLLTVLTVLCTAFGLVALTDSAAPVDPPGGGPSGPAAPNATSGATSGAGSDDTALPPHAVPFGLFLGSDESDAEEAKVSQWLGGAPIQVGHTYLPGNHWDDIEGSPTLLGAWAVWKAEQPQRMLVIGTPMLPDNEGDVPDDEVQQQLREGADGQNDAHFTTLARRLVALGLPDAVLTLGWEMNGTTYTSRCGPDPTAWKAYWRHIVTAMRAVPGQHLRFEFAPTRGADAHPWPDCYPGDDVTDVIGMDSYDMAADDPDVTADFDSYIHEPYGLLAQVRFARQHRKPVSYPEWGMYNRGDDPVYVQRMLEWISTHDTLYQTVTDYCPHGVWRCPSNPRASGVFRRMLSAAPPPGPTPTTTSGPAASASASATAAATAAATASAGATVAAPVPVPDPPAAPRASERPAAPAAPATPAAPAAARPSPVTVPVPVSVPVPVPVRTATPPAAPHAAPPVASPTAPAAAPAAAQPGTRHRPTSARP
jgi:Glycosyl hydrolase family 26